MVVKLPLEELGSLVELAWVKIALEELGSLAELARRLKVSKQAVQKWSTGKQRVTAEQAIAIESATGSAVKRYHVRPDLWPPPSRRARRAPRGRRAKRAPPAASERRAAASAASG